MQLENVAFMLLFLNRSVSCWEEQTLLQMKNKEILIEDFTIKNIYVTISPHLQSCLHDEKSLLEFLGMMAAL